VPIKYRQRTDFIPQSPTSMARDDTSDTVNRLLEEYLAMSTEGQTRVESGVASAPAGSGTAPEHEWLAAVVAGADDAIVGSTLDGRIVSWNAAAARLFGWTAAEAIGSPLDVIIPPEFQEEAHGVLARVRAGERVGHFETVRLDRHGRRLDVSMTVSPVKDPEGRICGVSKIAREIGERKRDERATREADRRKDEFLATLSHELRNPLAPMRNATDVLRRAQHADSPIQTASVVIDRQLGQLTRLVDDLLDVSRFTSGRVDLIKEDFDLGAVLRTLQVSLQPAFAASRQTFRLSLPAEPLYVEADRARLMQVFTNLLTNANKYTPDGGFVGVEGHRDGRNIVVCVRDTGIGIAAGMLERVFDLFAQVDRSTQHTRGGLGIGLTVSKRLLEAHGGRIRAHSDGPGKGTQFIVELPAGAPVD
jgi:PAS domain S-box-containing protein